jgi:hypothetical protein
VEIVRQRSQAQASGAPCPTSRLFVSALDSRFLTWCKQPSSEPSRPHRYAEGFLLGCLHGGLNSDCGSQVGSCRSWKGVSEAGTWRRVTKFRFQNSPAEHAVPCIALASSRLPRGDKEVARFRPDQRLGRAPLALVARQKMPKTTKVRLAVAWGRTWWVPVAPRLHHLLKIIMHPSWRLVTSDRVLLSIPRGYEVHKRGKQGATSWQ